MTVAGLRRRRLGLATAAKVVPVVVALGLLSGCVVVPAYGPGPGPGYYRPAYYSPYYYRDREDYYRRW
jgi:hypothetical protein